MVVERRSAAEVRDQAVKEGVATLRNDAVSKALAGRATPEEVLRVTRDCEQPA